MREIAIHAAPVRVVGKPVDQVLAHGDQPRGAVRRQVEPAEEFVPARLAGDVERPPGGIVRRVEKRLRGIAAHGNIDAEGRRQRVQRAVAPLRVERVVALEDRLRDRHARRLAALRQQRLEQLRQVTGTRRAFPPGEVDQRPAALGDRCQDIVEERGHRTRSLHIGTTIHRARGAAPSQLSHGATART